MTEHLPECPILKPCCDDEQFPEHGFCGNYAGRCLHCMAECICAALRACEARVLREAQLRVAAIRDPWPVTAPGTIKRSDAIAAIKSGGWRSNEKRREETTRPRESGGLDRGRAAPTGRMTMSTLPPEGAA